MKLNDIRGVKKFPPHEYISALMKTVSIWLPAGNACQWFGPVFPNQPDVFHYFDGDVKADWVGYEVLKV